MFNFVGNVNTAFVYENGKMYDLNKLLINPPPGLFLGIAFAINDQGQVIAEGQGNTGYYLLTPSDLPAPPTTIPEPSSWSLFGLLFLWAGRRFAKTRGRQR